VSAVGRPRVAVVDYGAGNLVSIDQAFERVGADVTIAHGPDDLRSPDAVVVPGVGAARPAMERLDARGLTDALRPWLGGDRPFLGICLGLQLLFVASDEDGAETLGAIPGRTVRLDGAPTLPHIGWNQVERTRDHPLFDGIPDGADFYFVHSYAGAPASAVADAVVATTEHGARFTSAIARDALVGVQFHPERSGDDGLRLLANFVDLVRAA
jgi:glutamine amidotransferase